METTKQILQTSMAGIQISKDIFIHRYVRCSLTWPKAEIFWVDEKDPGKGTWYTVTVKEYRMTDKKHLVEFDDGDKEWYLLDDIRYRVLEHIIIRVMLVHANKQYQRRPSYATGIMILPSGGAIGRRVKIFGMMTWLKMIQTQDSGFLAQ